MKAKLLRKIRKEHPIYFDTTTDKFQYRTNEVHLCFGGTYENRYKSEWVDDINELMQIRREIIISDAINFFNKKTFTYKRRRSPIVVRVF